MARSRCTCGAVILWKADEEMSDEWIMIAKPDIGDDLDEAYHKSTSAAFCPTCGHLWVAWGRDGRLTEYAPVDSSSRPRRL